jgi:proteasome alpha subunit
MEPTSVEKIHKADDHAGIASAGHVADARQLIDFARRQAQVNRLRYGEAIGIETLTKEVTDHIQQYTQVGGARPFGVALLIGGVEDGEPRLYETDPSGTPYEWKAVSIGADRSDLQDYLEEHYDDDLDLDGGIDLALRTIDSASEDPLTSTSVDVATVHVEDGTFHELPRDEVASHIEAAGLGAADGDDEDGDDEDGNGEDETAEE